MDHRGVHVHIGHIDSDEFDVTKPVDANDDANTVSEDAATGTNVGSRRKCD